MSASVPPEARPVRRSDTISSEVLDELVVYAPASSQAISLNRTARAIWELCDGTRTVETLCLELAEAAGTTPDAIRNDVLGALDQLRNHGLIANDAG